MAEVIRARRESINNRLLPVVCSLSFILNYSKMKAGILTSVIGLFLATAQIVSAADASTDATCALVGGTSDTATAKDEQLAQFTISDDGTQETTQFGVKVNNSDSLKAGLDGPTLLQDFQLLEKLQHFGTAKSIFT